jgi:hypothetical protein
MRRRATRIAAVLAPLAVAAAAACSRGLGAQPVRQPIAFDHQRHAAEGMACADCHARAADHAQAGHPRLQSCLLCHAEPKGSHPDEPLIRRYAEEKREIPWVRVNRTEGHVYFSHEAHVTWAAMDCAECHGAVKDRATPTTAPQVGALTMARCMECHQQRGARDDCLACHK